jgi:protein TonB
LRRPLAIGLGLLVLVAAVWWVCALLSRPKSVHKPTLRQIALVRPNLPPPPKPQDKPPEPEKLKEEVKLDTPKMPDEPKPVDAPPPAASLGLDAAGDGAGDAFGLAANRGGRDLTAPTIGGAGGASRLAYAFYRDVVTRHINDELNRVDALKGTSGQVAVLVWIDRTGRIERIDLRDATEEQSRLIRERLMASRALREVPPDTMPQPVWVLMNLRELG